MLFVLFKYMVIVYIGMPSFLSCIKNTGNRILDDRYDHIGRYSPVINDRNIWKEWNYNVGHNECVEDKYNSDLIALLFPLTPISLNETIMVYDPSLYNKKITKKDNSYQISHGTYDIYFFHEMNIESSISPA